MTEMITVKLSFEGEVRRFPVDGTSFTALYEQIISLLGLEKNAELILKYTDEQGDIITMASDMELKSAIVKGQILRVAATYKGKDATAPPTPCEVKDGKWHGCGRAVDKGCKKEWKKEHKHCKKMWKGAHHGRHGPFGHPHGPFGPHARGPCGPHARGPFGPHARGPFGPHTRGSFGHCNPEKFSRKGMKYAEKFAKYEPLVDAVLANEHLKAVKRRKVFKMFRKYDGDKEKVVDALTKKVLKKAEKLALRNEGEKQQKASADLMAF